MNADKIKELRDSIRAFDEECAEAQHTDGEYAWGLLNACEDTLGQLVNLQRNYEKMTQKAEHGCTDAYCRMCDG